MSKAKKSGQEIEADLACNEGNTLIQRGEYAEALNFYNHSISLNPTFEAYTNKGSVLKMLGKFSDAITPFEEALKLNPQSAFAHTNLAYAFENYGDYTQAAHFYEEAIKIGVAKTEEFDNYFGLGNCLMASGDLPKALDNFELAIKSDGTRFEGFNNQGMALQKLGKIDQAIISYNSAIEKNPAFAQSYCNKGNALNVKGDYAQALQCFKKAIELDPRYANAHVNKAIALLNIQNYAEAMEAYEIAKRLEPSHPKIQEIKDTLGQHTSSAAAKELPKNAPSFEDGLKGWANKKDFAGGGSTKGQKASADDMKDLVKGAHVIYLGAGEAESMSALLKQMDINLPQSSLNSVLSALDVIARRDAASGGDETDVTPTYDQAQLVGQPALEGEGQAL